MLNLTLTSVVFEYKAETKPKETVQNLTLTSVVFEFHIHDTKINYFLPFNFNKCCI